MAKQSAVMTIQYPAQVQISSPEFDFSPSLAHLDVERLSKAASTEIEVGSVKSNCGRQTLRAFIRKGKVTALYADPCADSKPASPDQVRLIKAALSKVAGPNGPPKWKPVPVAYFLQNAERLTINGWICIKICIFGHCLFCCAYLTTRSFCRISVAAPVAG